MADDPRIRALLATAHQGVVVADWARTIVCDLGTPMSTRDRIRQWRTLRLHAMAAVDRCVLMELAAGAAWDEVAEAYGLSEEELRARFDPALAAAANRGPGEQPWDPTGEMRVGSALDSDVDGTVASLDSWIARHCDPWDQVEPAPIARALSSRSGRRRPARTGRGGVRAFCCVEVRTSTRAPGPG